MWALRGKQPTLECVIRRKGADLKWGNLRRKHRPTEDDSTIKNIFRPDGGSETSPCSSCGEWEKTEAQQQREKRLLEELVYLVNKRDELVQKLDEQERVAVEEEEHVTTTLERNKGNLVKEEKNCVIQ
ncbi:EH domain binding protein 1 [Branchiostoma belcheri]|nr:EH domain binding protein 1 [Branchiostoma belcheri]